jgi:hypothetical protein
MSVSRCEIVQRFLFSSVGFNIPTKVERPLPFYPYSDSSLCKIQRVEVVGMLFWVVRPELRKTECSWAAMKNCSARCSRKNLVCTLKTLIKV